MQSRHVANTAKVKPSHSSTHERIDIKRIVLSNPEVNPVQTGDSCYSLPVTPV